MCQLSTLNGGGGGGGGIENCVESILLGKPGLRLTFARFVGAQIRDIFHTPLSCMYLGRHTILRGKFKFTIHVVCLYINLRPLA